MPIDLNASLKWQSASPDEIALLADLQGNILKGHGRRATRHLFIRFSDDRERAKRFVSQIAHLLVSAQEQLRAAEAFKVAGVSGGPFVGFYLSFKGYVALGLEALAPADEAFRQGMLARGAALADPPVEALEARYRGDLHAMILLAGDPDDASSWTSTAVDDLETRILNLMSGAAKVVASEAGRAIFNAAGEGLEHFGYVDGRSQPLLLAEDVARERNEKGGVDQWNPEFPLKQVLVKDTGSASASATAFGSYFVFRKLEQNVKAFKAAEAGLGQAAGNGELAGATVVGRWEDGTAVLLSGKDGQTDPISNNFNYAADPAGAKCPLHAHIRKTNPRGESATKVGIPEAEERAHIMARRGITYGRRNRITVPTDEPEGGVGLLFMAFQSDVGNQFEFTQATWANNPDFLDPTTGRDAIIGQGGLSVLAHPRAWNHPEQGTVDRPFGIVAEGRSFVTLKGGEYFFAPSRSALLSL